MAGLNKLVSALGVSTALVDFGMRDDDVDKVATMAMDRPHGNAGVSEKLNVRELVRRAWAADGEDGYVGTQSHPHTALHVLSTSTWCLHYFAPHRP